MIDIYPENKYKIDIRVENDKVALIKNNQVYFLTCNEEVYQILSDLFNLGIDNTFNPIEEMEMYECNTDVERDVFEILHNFNLIDAQRVTFLGLSHWAYTPSFIYGIVGRDICAAVKQVIEKGKNKNESE